MVRILLGLTASLLLHERRGRRGDLADAAAAAGHADAGESGMAPVDDIQMYCDLRRGRPGAPDPRRHRQRRRWGFLVPALAKPR